MVFCAIAAQLAASGAVFVGDQIMIGIMNDVGRMPRGNFRHQRGPVQSELSLYVNLVTPPRR